MLCKYSVFKFFIFYNEACFRRWIGLSLLLIFDPWVELGFKLGLRLGLVGFLIFGPWVGSGIFCFKLGKPWVGLRPLFDPPMSVFEYSTSSSQHLFFGVLNSY